MQPSLATQNEKPDQEELLAQFPSSLRLERLIENYFDTIRALPLFKDIPMFVLYDILRQAHIVSYNKGAVPMTHGEEVAHFYIVLDGWVKIFKNNTEGKETILQIIGKNDFLMEAGVVGAPICGASVQVVENTKLLALPLPQLRDHFMRSSAMAENLLAMFAGRTQAVLNHLEQLTLRNAQQRVGWFMLKLWLEASPGSMEITLPYDKALIASYLDIRAETLSRILRNFHKDGFVINGLHVKLPNAKALCKYCDSGLAHRCPDAQPHCLTRPTV